MNTLRKLLLAFCTLAVAGVIGPAHAEVLTATFSGLANGYENHGPDGTINFVDNAATGSLILDPAQLTYNSAFAAYAGPGIKLTFNLRGQTSVWGGSTPFGIFMAGGDASGQGVGLEAMDSCFCFAARLDFSGPPGAFGPDDLTPASFHPGPVKLPGAFADFGDRYLGAHIRLTSITMTQGTQTVVSSVPEPATVSMLFVGIALLVAAAQVLRRHQSFDDG